MSHLFFLVFVISTCLLVPTSSKVIFESVTLDWEWPSDAFKDAYIKSGDYKPEACQPSGIQVSQNGEIFITVPRLRYSGGVPSGLNTILLKGGNSTHGVLRPFPDWDTNKLGNNCSKLQLPMATSLDPRTGYLYVIDGGRVGIMSPANDTLNLCPGKIVVFDTRAGGQLVRMHEFPDNVVPRTKSFMNDLVLDYVDVSNPTEVKYAYISDSFENQIIVFDFTTNSSWSFKHPSMNPDDDRNITINSATYTFNIGINGIAMSPSFNYVYYTALGSKKLYQIPTWVLRQSDADFSVNVRLVGNKKSNSDALAAGHKSLYYGILSDNALYRWELERDIQAQGGIEGQVTLQTETLLALDSEALQWIDGIGFGNEVSPPNTIYFLSARAQKFHNGLLDFTGGDGANFRLFQIEVNETSYIAKRYPFGFPTGIIG